MSLTEFLDVRLKIRYCPRCKRELYQHATNTAVLVCLQHGNVMSIMQTTAGYRIEVSLAVD